MSKHRSSPHGSGSSKSTHIEITQNDLSLLDLPTGEEILDEEMKQAEADLQHTEYPEIENYSEEDLKKSMTTTIGKEIQQAFDEDARLDYLAEEIVKERKEHPFSKLLSHVLEKADKVDRNVLFDEKQNDVVTKTNEPLVLALVERLLGNIGRKHSIADSERAELISYRYEKIKDQKNPMEIVQAFYPKLEQEAMSQTKKLEILTKVSILMMILPVPKVDEFIERNIFIDKMLQGADFKTAVDYTLKSSLQFEIKNHGVNYNYRIEEFIAFLENVKKRIKNRPTSVKETIWWDQDELDIFPNYKKRYEAMQKRLISMQEIGATDNQLYTAYLYLSGVVFHKFHLNGKALQGDDYDYLRSLKILANNRDACKETFLFFLKHRKVLPDHIKPNLHSYFAIDKLRKLGVTIKEMRKAGVTADVLHDGTYGIREMFESGITIKEMVDEGVMPQLLHKEGITYQQQHEAGITLEEMYSSGVSLSDMNHAGIEIKTIEKELFGEYPDTVLFNLWKENTQLRSYMVMNEHVLDEHRNGAPDEKLWNKLYTEDMQERYKHTFIKKYILELEKLKKIKIQPQMQVNKDTRYLESFNSTIEVGGKAFYVLRPDKKNSPDIWLGSPEYKEERYIRGTILKKEVKKAGLHLFKNKQEAEEFINKHIPGATFSNRVLNFANLIGLKKSGYRNPGPHHPGWKFLGERMCARLSEPEGEMTCALGSSDKESALVLRDIKKCLPVVCFQYVIRFRTKHKDKDNTNSPEGTPMLPGRG